MAALQGLRVRYSSKSEVSPNGVITLSNYDIGEGDHDGSSDLLGCVPSINTLGYKREIFPVEFRIPISSIQKLGFNQFDPMVDTELDRTIHVVEPPELFLTVDGSTVRVTLCDTPNYAPFIDKSGFRFFLMEFEP